MKKIILLSLLITSISNADYIIYMPLKSIPLSFKDDVETPLNTPYKVTLKSTSDGISVQASHDNYMNLMVSNWTGGSIYFVLQSKNLDNITNAYFMTQSTGPHPLVVNLINTFEDDRYFYSLTSTDPLAPVFDIESNEYDYDIKFDVVSKNL